MGKRKSLAVGDRVRYTRAWLRSTCSYTGPLPRARGTVTAIDPFGRNALVTVDWGHPDIPPRVLNLNLERCR